MPDRLDKLIVGLGNPGPRYETTRHNVGFLMLDELVDHFHLEWSGKKFDGEIGKGPVFGMDTFLLKPLTFMNRSGHCVGQILNYFKIQPEDMIVLYDDVDLEFGTVKARFGGGHGGHNGIRDILRAVSGQDFHRIKVGVGRPEENRGGVADWVLAPMADKELLDLQQSVLQNVLLRLENVFKQWQSGAKRVNNA